MIHLVLILKSIYLKEKSRKKNVNDQNALLHVKIGL